MSGLGLVIGLSFIGGIYFYSRIVPELPTSFPYERYVIPILWLAITLGSIRTFLKQPDRLYFVRFHSGISSYFRKAFLYSLTLQSLLVICALAAIWPLHKHGSPDGSMPFGIVMIYFLLLKTASLAERWDELRLLYPLHRLLLMSYRWGVWFAALTLLFTSGLLLSILIALCGIGIGKFIRSRLPKLHIHWDLLIEEERKTQSRWHSGYSWFTDVPLLGTIVHHRKYGSNWISNIPMRQKLTYVYLYALTFVRTEVGSIVLRLVTVGAFMIILSENSWISLAAAILFIMAITFQASTLSQLHQYRYWPHVYPLASSLQYQAAGTIAFIVSILCWILLLLVWVITNEWFVWWPVIGASGILILWIFTYRSIPKRMRGKDKQ